MAYNCEQELRKKDKHIAELETEIKRLREFAEAAAKQQLSGEMSADESLYADYDGAYDLLVLRARKALEGK